MGGRAAERLHAQFGEPCTQIAVVRKDRAGGAVEQRDDRSGCTGRRQQPELVLGAAAARAAASGWHALRRRTEAFAKMVLAVSSARVDSGCGCRGVGLFTFGLVC